MAAGASAATSFDLRATGGGNYDYSCYGPNGFQRRFVGNTQQACGSVDIVSVIDPSLGLLALVMHNSSESPVTFTIRANAYRGDGPWIQTLPANSSASAPFFLAGTSDGWYDFTASLDGDPLFMRQFAGRIEPSGQPRPQLSFSIAGGKLFLTWTNSPSAKLQTSLNLNANSWIAVSVPNGQSSYTTPIDTSAAFFRLTE